MPPPLKFDILPVSECVWTSDKRADAYWDSVKLLDAVECHCARCFDGTYPIEIDGIDMTSDEWQRAVALLREWGPPASIRISSYDSGCDASEQFEQWVFATHRADFRVLGRDPGIFNYAVMCWHDKLL